MSAEPWAEIEAVLAEAADLPASERTALLDARCADRPDVRREVESLLSSLDRAGTFLDVRSPVESRTQPPVTGDGVGQIVGRFRLLERIGEGGMGVVYRAERADAEFAEQVAVKLLRDPIHHTEALRRFRVERQILATLNHPDIVTLLDAGVTDAGQAFLAMKYIAGTSIVQHCAEHRLSLDERIQLFQRVCAAVQYAHQNGVVHRDLKPANILVTPDGLPKVLDFGVAKLLHDASGTLPDPTVTAAPRPMTLGYASPEQVRGLAATTASDVYALGVVLYEVVTGARPFTTNHKSLDEVIRIVLETEPPRPSRTVAAAPLPYDLGALRGDLDAIVLRALRKAPDERYRSAAALADDLARYRAGRPVEAREPSLGYVLRRLAARHRAVFATGVLSLVVILGLLATSVWQARVARDERDRARVEASKAREIASFLGGMFQSANPVQAGGQTLTARDLLDRGTADITAQLKGQPDIQASLLLVMSEAYERIGVQPRALELARQSLALREQISGSSGSVDVADSLHLVGRTLRRLGRSAEAIDPLDRALSMRESLLGRDHRAVAVTLRELALARRDIGERDAGRAMIERAIGIEERAAPASATLALLYNNLATGLHEDGDLDAARTAYQRSLATYALTEDGGGFSVAIPLVNLGTLTRTLEDFGTARSLFTRALAANDRWLGPDNAGQAYVYGCLGDLARAQGDYAQAHRYLAESFRIYGKTRPVDHIELAAPLTYLGETLLAEGDSPGAIAALERALRIRERTHGPEHQAIAETLVPLARAHMHANRVDQALFHARRALAIQRQTLPANHPSLVATLTVLGDGLVRQQRVDEARPLLEQAVAVAGERLPRAHSQRVAAETALRQLK